MNKHKKTNSSLIESAFNLYSQGKHADALTICKKMLGKNLNDINALNLTGFIKDKQGEKEEAIRFFKKASKLDSGNAEILTNIGITYFEINKLTEAKKFLQEALKKNPLATEALFNLANIALTELDTEQAILLYNNTIKLRADHVRSYNNLGNIWHKKKDLKKAEHCYKLAIEIAPDFVEALTGLTYVLIDDEKKEEALTYGKKVIEIQPDNAEILILLGRIYISKNQLEDAKNSLFRAISIDNTNPISQKLYGAVLESLNNQSTESVLYFKRAFELDPTQAIVAGDAGKCCLRNGNFEDAKYYLKASLDINPDNADILNVLGTVYQELRDYSVAKELFEKSLLVDPSYSLAHNNMGNLHLELQDTKTAGKYFNKAYSLDPDNINSKTNLCILSLLTEDYENGWQHYRFRPSVSLNGADFSPDALPDTLQGKKVLIIKDQGIGDELFFLRFIKKLKSYGPHISYLPNPKLLPILKPLDLVDSLLIDMPDKKDFDLCLSVGDLAYLLSHKSASDTPPPLLLVTDPDETNNVKKILSEFGPPPYIGITWRAGCMINNKRLDAYLKDIDLKSISEVIKNVPGTIIAIQKNAPRSDFEFISKQIGRPVLDASVYHDNLAKMLSLLNLLDKYITVSNTNVHLREGLHKKSHVLVCSPPEWRWLEKGKTSHWFPSSYIYRQESDGNWQSAINELVSELTS